LWIEAAQAGGDDWNALFAANYDYIDSEHAHVP